MEYTPDLEEESSLWGSVVEDGEDPSLGYSVGSEGEVAAIAVGTSERRGSEQQVEQQQFNSFVANSKMS